MATPLVASIDGPRARILHAREDLNAFEAGIKSVIEGYNEPAVVKENPKTGKPEFRVTNLPEISPFAAIRAGMIAHNLRAALDGLAYQLAIINAEGFPSNKDLFNVEFPIHINGPRTKHARLKEPTFKRNWRSTKPLGRFITPIERLQPYRRGNGHRKNPLWLLDSLNNTDKHRLLVMLAIRGRSTTMRPSPTAPVYRIGNRVIMVLDGATLTAGRKLKEGTKIGEAHASSPENVHVDIHSSLEVIFGEGCPAVEGLPVVRTLREICARVGDVIEDFAPFF